MYKIGELVPAYEIVTRVCQLPDEDKPHRHKFYKHFGKVGTTATTVIWTVDELPRLGEGVTFVDENDYVFPEDRKKYMKYLSYHQVHYGIVDKINDDRYIFINRLS